MTNTTRSNELNSVIASLLAPTNVSPVMQGPDPLGDVQQDGNGPSALLAGISGNAADIPVQHAPRGASGMQAELAPADMDTAEMISLDGLEQPFQAASATTAIIGLNPTLQLAPDSVPQAGSVEAPAVEPGLVVAATASADTAITATPAFAVATSHDESISFLCLCTACTGASDKPAPPATIGPAAGDDIPDDISSTVTLAIGGTLLSSIQSAGDRDYIKVSLVAGQTYTFSLEGNGLVDPYLELRSSSNAILKEDDDGGILFESFLTYTPTVSGDYFLVARDYGADTGGYALSAKAIPTGSTSPTTLIDNGKTKFSWDEAAIQISRTGASWAPDFDSSAIVTYAYRSTAPTTMPSDTAGFTRFTAAQIAANEAALAAWAEVANISFVRVGTGTSGEAAYSNSATMLFSNYGSGASGAAAFAYLPSTANTASSSAQGDVWINSSLSYNSNPVIGDYGPHVLLHEIGHAIGLSHPGEYNAAPGVSITYPANAEYFNDSRMFTSMSYFGSSSTGGNLQAFASTPSLHDIAAVQRLFGANMTTRTGDNTYGFNSNVAEDAFSLTLPTQVAVFSIWDAGGNDTLDLSGYTQSATIDLREEAFTSAGGGTHNISIARGAVIENAIGGSGDDTITGNASDNTLRGNDGFDTLNGGDGNDLLIGGAGGDVLNGGAGADTASYEASAASVFIDLQSGIAAGGDALSDTLSTVENIIGSAFNDTLNGDGNANTISGLGGNDAIQARGGSDTINPGDGDDTVDGGDGNDTINLGAFLTALDTINGGADSDTLNLNGNYSAGITLSDTTLTNVERINVTAGNSYRLTLADATVAAGAQLIVDGTTLASGQTLTLIGTAETNGTFDLRGGAGNDDLRGGAGNDILSGGAGADVLAGGGGIDRSSYAGTSSTSVSWGRNPDGSWSINAAELGDDALSSIEFIEFSDRSVFLDKANQTFFGDGTSDILWRRNDGITAIWNMSGSTVSQSGVTAWQASLDWAVEAVGDFDGDGRDDLLWRNSNDGVTAIWSMNGFGVTAANVTQWQAGLDWQIEGIADFNGDGRDDFLWRRSVDGVTAIWQMDGTSVASANVTQWQAGLEWQIIGIGDFNSDGRNDIVWRRSSDGVTAIWQMDGFAI